MEVKVVDSKGKATSDKITLAASVFGVEPNDHAIYLDVKQYLANKRQGTHKSKERGEITGSTKKIKKQKGTGTARAGSIKSPVFRGGGRVFGPRPRNYGFKLNAKLKRVARRSALTYKAKDGNVLVVDTLKFKEPKTKDFKAITAALKVDNARVLFVIDKTDNNIYKSARNIPLTKVVTVDSLNTYDVLNAKNIVFVKDAIQSIEKILN